MAYGLINISVGGKSYQTCGEGGKPDKLCGARVLGPYVPDADQSAAADKALNEATDVINKAMEAASAEIGGEAKDVIFTVTMDDGGKIVSIQLAAVSTDVKVQ